MKFNQLERSWDIFVLLESFTDSMGGWKIVDVLGKPLVALEDWLVEDLTLLRWLGGITQRQLEEVEKSSKSGE